MDVCLSTNSCLRRYISFAPSHACGYRTQDRVWTARPGVPPEKFIWAGSNGLTGLNVNNIEQIQAIMLAVRETDSPVIIQASRGARTYGNDSYLRHPSGYEPSSMMGSARPELDKSLFAYAGLTHMYMTRGEN